MQLLPPDKKREPDEALRLAHIETLILLCTTRWGRDYLRDNGVYEVIRTLHLQETSEQVHLFFTSYTCVTDATGRSLFTSRGSSIYSNGTKVPRLKMILE